MLNSFSYDHIVFMYARYFLFKTFLYKILHLTLEYVTTCNGRDLTLSESNSEIQRNNTKFSTISQIWCVLHVLWGKKREGEMEEDIHWVLIIQFPHCARELSSRESLIENFCTPRCPPSSLVIFRLSSLCLSRTDLKRVIGLHGDAQDKRKEGRRDAVA